MKRVVKTPGQRLHEHAYDRGKVLTKWNDLTFLSQQDYESDAADLGIQPIEEDVPLTDGELWIESWKTENSNDAAAAKFLRLRAERDGDKGEPLEVTSGLLNGWMSECCSSYLGFQPAVLAAKINAHRGVRSLPKVTPSMINAALDASLDCKTEEEGHAAAADYINAALAKAKDGE